MITCSKLCYIFITLQMNSADRALLNAFREISQMADRLNLPKIVAVSILH